MHHINSANIRFSFFKNMPPLNAEERKLLYRMTPITVHTKLTEHELKEHSSVGVTSSVVTATNDVVNVNNDFSVSLRYANLEESIRKHKNTDQATPHETLSSYTSIDKNKATSRPNRSRTKKCLDHLVSCSFCKRTIENRYLLSAIGKYWHEKCLKCDFCRKPLYKLGDRFYYRQGAKFCHEDFLRTFGARGTCCMCDQQIPPTDYVLRFKGDLLYHLECFKCIHCRTQFCVGDPVTITEPKQIACVRCRYVPVEGLKKAYLEHYGDFSSHPEDTNSLDSMTSDDTEKKQDIASDSAERIYTYNQMAPFTATPQCLSESHTLKNYKN